jgi:ubiquinone biosynthesis protein COQ4
MHNPLNVLRALSAWVTIVRDPDRLGEVFALADNLADDHFVGKMADHFALSPVGKRALASLPRVGNVDLAALRLLPEGTLGRAFAEHMIANGLDPAALPSLPATERISFVRAHLYETHDIWHAVTDFRTDVAGELGLQAFYLAQFPARLGAAILAAGLLNTLLFRFEERDARMDEIVRGWLIGRKASPFFGVDWASKWAEPIEAVRRELGVELGEVDGFMGRLQAQRRTPKPTPMPTPTLTLGRRETSRSVTR